MVDYRFLNSLDFFEPRCPHCSTKLEYGVTTKHDPKTGKEVCKKCNTAIEDEAVVGTHDDSLGSIDLD